MSLSICHFCLQLLQMGEQFKWMRHTAPMEKGFFTIVEEKAWTWAAMDLEKHLPVKAMGGGPICSHSSHHSSRNYHTKHLFKMKERSYFMDLIH